MPRLATVVPKVVSPTLIPITSPRVKILLTSGRPNSVVLANSASRCSGCGFIVIVVNSTFSISVTVRVSACSNTCPSENSSKYRPAISPSRSVALEHRTAFLDEGGDRLLVVLGKRTTRLVLGFEIEHGLEALGLGREQVALDVGQRNARPGGDTARQCHRLGLQFVVGHDLVDDAEPSGFIGIDDIGREVEFARLGSADQPGQAPGTAIIAGIADARKGGAEPGRFAGNPQVAGERQTQPGTGDGAVDHADNGLRVIAQPRREVVPPAQPLGPVLDWLGAGARLHCLDITAGAPAAPGPGNDDRAALAVGRQPFERLL